MGGSSAFSGGKSSSTQQPGSVWGGQVPYLQALFQNAFNTMNGQSGFQGGTGPGGMPDPAPIKPVLNPGHSGKGAMQQYDQQLAQWQARQGQGGQSQAGGAGGQVGGQSTGLPNITDYSAGLAKDLMDQANGQSPYLQQQIGDLGQNIGQFFNQQLLPGIASDAGGYGQFGGSRQSIAQGMGAQQALQSFQQGATELYQNNWNTGAQRATDLYNLGMQPYSAQWSPLLEFANLLGRPTVLDGGGQANGWDAGTSGSFSMTGGGGGGGGSGVVKG